MTDDLIDEMRPANDALAEAMRAAGYQRVERRLPAAHREVQNNGPNAALKWRNAELTQAIADLERQIGERDQRILDLERENETMRIEFGMPLEAIAEALAMRTGVTIAELRSSKRSKRVCQVRAHFCYLASRQHGFSRPEIGDWLNRDQSTVTTLAANHAARLRAQEASQ